jgi:hypothetical protein
MAGTVAPFPYHQLFDNNGVPAAGYKLFAYAAGTTTKLNTYLDASLSQANTNPIVLDSSGRASIFLTAASYKFVLALPADSDPPSQPIWTIDEVSALAPFNPSLDVTAVAGESLLVGDCVHLADGAGGLTGGRWYKADSDNQYQSSGAPMLGFATGNISLGGTGTVRIMGRITGLSGLTTGARHYVSATAGALTTTEQSNNRLVGYADSVSTLILTPAPLQRRRLTIEIGSPGGGVLTSGVKRYVWLPFTTLITGWTLLAEQSGSIVIDVWSDTYANFPPTVADTIAGSEKPTLSAVQKNQDLGLSTWTALVPRGNVLGFNIDSITTVNYVSLTLELLTV